METLKCLSNTFSTAKVKYHAQGLGYILSFRHAKGYISSCSCEFHVHKIKNPELNQNKKKL